MANLRVLIAADTCPAVLLRFATKMVIQKMRLLVNQLKPAMKMFLFATKI